MSAEEYTKREKRLARGFFLGGIVWLLLFETTLYVLWRVWP